MKNNKPDAALVWKQLEDDLVPRLGLNLTERMVYAHLLRHSRLEGKRLLRFSIPCFARSARLSDQTARQAVRSLAAKGALRLVDRTQAGHLADVFLPEEIQAVPHKAPVPACLARRLRTDNLEELDFLRVSSRREAIHARERGQCFYCLRRFVALGESSTMSSRLPAGAAIPTAISFPAASSATPRREKRPPKIFCAPSIACAA